MRASGRSETSVTRTLRRFSNPEEKYCMFVRNADGRYANVEKSYGS